jgi:hypothetical protein
MMSTKILEYKYDMFILFGEFDSNLINLYLFFMSFI